MDERDGTNDRNDVSDSNNYVEETTLLPFFSSATAPAARSNSSPKPYTPSVRITSNNLNVVVQFTARLLRISRLRMILVAAAFIAILLLSNTILFYEDDGNNLVNAKLEPKVEQNSRNQTDENVEESNPITILPKKENSTSVSDERSKQSQKILDGEGVGQTFYLVRDMGDKKEQKEVQSTLTSNYWAPMVLEKCLEGMPLEYAPCLMTAYNKERKKITSPLKTRIIHAEELILPDFRIRIPFFFNDEQKKLWLDNANEQRFVIHDIWAYYHNQHAQNMVFENAFYDGKTPPADVWAQTGCMEAHLSHKTFDADKNYLNGAGANEMVEKKSTSYLSDAKPFLHPKDRVGTIIEHGTMLFSPDSWSFQHFLDRGTHVLIQGRHLYANDKPVMAISGRQPGSTVMELWDLLLNTQGDNDGTRFEMEARKALDHEPALSSFHSEPSNRRTSSESAKSKAAVMFSRSFSLPVFFKELVFSCRAILVHPYYAFRLAEIMGIRQFEKPLEERKKILYLSRDPAKTSGVMNGGRNVVNENELLDKLRKLCAERNQGEEVVVFDPKSFNSIHETAKFIASEVGAIIGPHGGSVNNLRWAARDTLIIEFIPTGRFAVMYWEEAGILGLKYYAILAASLDGMHNMNVPVQDIVGIVSKEFRVPLSEPTHGKPYGWDVFS